MNSDYHAAKEIIGSANNTLKYIDKPGIIEINMRNIIENAEFIKKYYEFKLEKAEQLRTQRKKNNSEMSGMITVAMLIFGCLCIIPSYATTLNTRLIMFLSAIFSSCLAGVIIVWTRDALLKIGVVSKTSKPLWIWHNGIFYRLALLIGFIITAITYHVT